MTDYYSVLDVPRDANEEQIRKRYHQLALQFHPDRAGVEGTTRFKEIQSAYEILSNPNKRSIYDRFGADAVDNPMFVALFFFSFMTGVMSCIAVLFFIIGFMLVLFIVFLVAYVDGKLPARNITTVNDNTQMYWNYVKVFSPLFVVDIFIGIATIGWIIIAIRERDVRSILVTICLISLIILSIIVPVIKDANDITALRGGSNFYLWRLWLIPMYIAVVSLSIFSVYEAIRAQWIYSQLNEEGNTSRWGFIKLFIALRVMRGICMCIFCALLACRVDELILTNYFVVIGLPFFLFGLLMFIEIVYYHIFFTRIENVSLGCCFVCLKFTFPVILLSLLCICVSLISRRLNDVHNVQVSGSGKIFPLSLALIPVYFILVIPFVFGLMFLLTACVSTRHTSTHGSNNPLYTCEGNEKEEQSGIGKNTNTQSREGRNKEEEEQQNNNHNNSRGNNYIVNNNVDDTEGNDSVNIQQSNNTNTLSLPKQERLSDID